MKFGYAVLSVALIWGGAPASAEDFSSDVRASDVMPEKATPFGLYMSSSKAHRLVSEDPDILLVDVRDPLEIALLGHPQPVDAVVPIHVQSDLFDPEINEYALVPNGKFLDQRSEVLSEAGKSKHDLIILTCGSGYRSAEAARKLSSAGYTNVWHIPNGYVGDDKIGMNVQNAWLNAGLPWSYSLIDETPWIKAVRKKHISN